MGATKLMPTITQDGPAPDGLSVNDPPPNFKEITERELAQETHFCSYTPDRVEYRQIVLPHGRQRQYSGVTLYWYWDGTGVGIEPIFWGVKDGRKTRFIRYYRFALCEHEFREVNAKECRDRSIYHAGMCWHVSECVRCGLVKSVDSSD